MVLHLRQVFMTPSGWPVVSPERYAGVENRKFSAKDLCGEWEIIRVFEPRVERNLEAGQILWGEGDLRDGEGNNSFGHFIKSEDQSKTWDFNADNQTLSLTINGEKFTDLVIHAGHDWERETNTVLFSGIDSSGRSIWGKKVGDVRIIPENL